MNTEGDREGQKPSSNNERLAEVCSMRHVTTAWKLWKLCAGLVLRPPAKAVNISPE